MWIVTVVGGPIESGPAAGTLSPGQEFSSWLPAQARGKKGGDWPGSPLRLTGGQEKEGGLWRLSAASQDARKRPACGIEGWVRALMLARGLPLGLSPSHLWGWAPTSRLFLSWDFWFSMSNTYLDTPGLYLQQLPPA